MANYITTSDELESVADAIREKGWTVDSLEYPNGFINAIDNIETNYDYVMGTLSGNYVNDFEFETRAGDTSISLARIYARNVKITGAATSMPDNAGLSTSITGIINLPTLTATGVSCWNADNVACTVIYMPNVTTVKANFFMGKNKANLVKMVIGAGPFSNTTASLKETNKLKALVFPRNAVASLSATSIFEKCGIYLNDDGYVYVPRDLIDSYKAATNWLNYPDKFRAIEDYPLINAPTTWLPVEESSESSE